MSADNPVLTDHALDRNKDGGIRLAGDGKERHVQVLAVISTAGPLRRLTQPACLCGISRESLADRGLFLL